MKRCPGNNGQCENTIPPFQALCGHCKLAEQQRVAAEALWVSQGLRALGEYLARWAAFEEIYGPN